MKCPDVIVESGVVADEKGCGLGFTDEPAPVKSYNALPEGSKNRLRAFVGRIESVIANATTAQYLFQDEVDEILGR